MPLVYDLETDIRFLQGFRAGLVIAEELSQTELKTKKIINLIFAKSISLEEIAKITDVSLEKVEEIRNRLYDDSKDYLAKSK